MQMLPRYVQLRVSSSGDTSYRFNPPQMLVDEGVVEREELDRFTCPSAQVRSRCAFSRNIDKVTVPAGH